MCNANVGFIFKSARLYYYVTILSGQGFHVEAYMIRTNPLLVSVILMSGLTTACDQNAATVDDSGRIPPEVQALGENVTVPGRTETRGATAQPPAVETPAVIAGRASAPERSATVASLPLRSGHYVNAQAPCDEAGSWARVALVSQTGMNLNCKFQKIEKTGATTYRVTSECSDGGAAWGREEGFETSTDTYDIPNDTSFRVTYEGGSEVSARYCARVSAAGT